MASANRLIRCVAALAGATAVAISFASTASAAPAETAFALSGTNLLSFDPAAPQTVTSKPITGVNPGESLVGIDIRPQNGMLYGLGVDAGADTATLYAIGRETGAVGAVGFPGSIGLTTDGINPADLPAGEYGFDFNPASDRVRVSTSNSLNFRIDANSGAAIDTNVATSGTQPDGAINGASTSVTGSAYTNNRANNGNITTLYTLDSASNKLAIQSPPNTGIENAVATVTEGGQPLDFTASGGFDIDPAVNVPSSDSPVASGVGYATLTVAGVTRLYTINLVTGTATAMGTIGDGTPPVQGLAVQRDFDDAGYPVIALSADGGTLLRFQSKTPSTISTQTIPGADIVAGETIVAIAWRPQTGQFFALGINAGADSGTLYRMDPQGAGVVQIGAPGSIAYSDELNAAVNLPPASSGWDMDFNPGSDRVRLVAGNGFNARANVSAGAPIDGDFGDSPGSFPGTNPDGVANGMSAGGIGPTAVAHTNSFPQAIPGGVTTAYVLDPGSNELAILNPPNVGTLTAGKPVTENGAALDFAAPAGLDIPREVAVTTSNSPATGSALAILNVGGVDRLYSVDLATAAATLLTTFPSALADLAVGDAQLDTPRPTPPGETPPGETPPGETPPDNTPPVDNAVDGAAIDLAKTLTIKGKELTVALGAGCAEACTSTASGTVLDKPSKKRGAKPKSYALVPASGSSAAGAKTTLTLKLDGSKKKRRKITHKIVTAIRHGHKVTASVSVRFADAAGNDASASGTANVKAK